MKKETYNRIRQLMSEQGIWEYTINMEIYTADQFINLFGQYMTTELINLIKANVNRLQAYCDERILEPLNN